MIGQEKVLAIGPMPVREVTGVSLAFKLVCLELKERNQLHKVVDTLKYSSGSSFGRFSFSHAFGTIRVLLVYCFNLQGADVVYATMSTSRVGFLRDFAITQLAFLFRKRIVFHLHGGGFGEFYAGQSRFFKWLIRYNHSRIDSIIVLGELLKAQFDPISPGIDRLIVVPNGLPLGVEEPKFHPKSICDQDSIRLLYLSNMMPSKGYLSVLDVCKELKNNGIRFECTFCGSFVNALTETTYTSVSEAEEDFKNRIQRDSLSDCISYLGNVSGALKHKVLQECHFLILPTSYPWEGQPLCIIEALAYGTPVLSTNHKGIPEQVIDSVNGYFIDPNDPQATCQQISSTIKQPSVYSNMSKAARTHYENNFKRDVHLSRLIAAIYGDKYAI